MSAKGGGEGAAVLESRKPGSGAAVPPEKVIEKRQEKENSERKGGSDASSHLSTVSGIEGRASRSGAPILAEPSITDRLATNTWSKPTTAWSLALLVTRPHGFCPPDSRLFASRPLPRRSRAT